MKTKARLFCSCLLLWMVIVFPAVGRSQGASVPLDDKARWLFEQLWDIELLQRNISQCYLGQKGSVSATSLAGQPLGEPAELDRELIDRVFARLAGTSEYERFHEAYRTLVQRPDHSRLYAAELFTEYMQLLESAKTRLTTQLKERQQSLTRDDPVPSYAEHGSVRADPGKAAAAEYFRIPLIGFAFLAGNKKAFSRIFLRGMDPSDSH
jgi:hypothetical protein